MQLWHAYDFVSLYLTLGRKPYCQEKKFPPNICWKIILWWVDLVSNDTHSDELLQMPSSLDEIQAS